jgi:hypothetical protein
MQSSDLCHSSTVVVRLYLIVVGPSFYRICRISEPILAQSDDWEVAHNTSICVHNRHTHIYSSKFGETSLLPDTNELCLRYTVRQVKTLTVMRHGFFAVSPVLDSSEAERRQAGHASRPPSRPHFSLS